MTSSEPRRELGGRPAAAAPAPARAFVAVLERRGRFLTAEPLFPPRRAPGAEGGPPAGSPRGEGGPRAQGGPPRGRGSARIVLKSGDSGRGGAGVRASAGELVLVQRSSGGNDARVVRVIGRPQIARDALEGLMLDRGLRRGFDPAVEKEAQAAAERLRRADSQRRDLRELATFTIDPVTARDFDDAISAEHQEDGTTRVWVHIADVAAHVPEGSLVDREARRRANSVYVPGAVEPMLPHALSSDACSLMPGVARAAVTVELQMQGAKVARAAFYRSLIRSDERLDYEQVDAIFAGRASAAEPWGTGLAAARDVAASLQQERERRGALVIDSEEPEFEFDQEGNVSAILAREQTESHRLIEHLMIAANEAVAGLLAQSKTPCLYRVHERPDPERIERLVDQLASLEVPTPPVPEHISPSQAADLVGPISRGVDEHVRRSGHGRIGLSSLVLRSLKQAYYSPRNLGHSGLRSTGYCHFTSPIRRYPDLVCHRALLSAVAGERAPRAGDLAELGAWTSERERDAMTIERDAEDVARCFALERALYEHGREPVFEGEIIGLISAGAFVAFGPPLAEGQAGEASVPYEGMLPVRRLGPAPAGGPVSSSKRPGRQGSGRDAGGERAPAREWWVLNEQGTILQGERSGARLRLGDPLEVRVSRVEAVRGRVDLRPAG
ncbi:MAG: RNB domain-containing ribonuclease [Solirubrobacteraceae bacterium]